MLNDLEQFTGTENHYKHWLGYKYTDGIKYLADKYSCYWLLDAIFSYNTKKFQTKHRFQIWEIKVYIDKRATLTMKEDTNLPNIIKQNIDYSDFSIPELKLYLIEGILLLPTEY